MQQKYGTVCVYKKPESLAHVQNLVTSGIQIMVTTPLPTQTTTSSSTQVKTVLTVAKFASGKTQPGATNWQQLGSGTDSLYVTVDTSAAGFTSTPIYVTSIGGDGKHFGTTGASAIYKPTPTSFQIEVRWDKDYTTDALTPEVANANKWHINWIAFEPFSQEGQGTNGQTSPTTTQPTPLPAAGKYYYLANKNSSKYLDVTNFSTADGANVQQWTLNKSGAQQWLLEDAGNGYYYLVNKTSSKVLNVSGGGSADGTNVIQWSKGNDDNSKWKLEDAGDGYFYLIAKHSGKALDVANAGTADGANVQQYSKNSTNAQKWKFEAV
ncbi:hypothetical protein NSTC745_01460 [Nostoc sp. DSM 114161]|jgi:hypothetical protein|uniref:RICIN domain-containing protein n=1 Tax=Nostoc sp. DSM 114161 TaxID=3440143 RepID=UPI0040456698